MNSEWNEEQVVSYYCRHLVAICVTYSYKNLSKREVKFRAVSGTVISINGKFLLLTAGHSLKNLCDATHHPDIEIHSIALADTFGPLAKGNKTIPFDFEEALKFFVDKDGLDFGLVALSSYYVPLLHANGIVATHPENWKKQQSLDFDGYVMLGFPEDSTSLQESGYAAAETVTAKVVATLIPITRLDGPPQDLTPTLHERFVGVIEPSVSIEDIAGMSGGPIFGFRHEPKAAYHVVAIQSSWIPNQRITFGCLMPTIGKILEEMVTS